MKEYSIDKANLGFGIFGSLAFVILGVLMATGVIGPEEGAAEIDRVGGIVLGWIAILFFGGLMLIALRFYFQSDEPVIRMDEAGFYDRRLSSKPIPWSEIQSAHIFRGKTLYAFTQRFVSLDVKNPDEYLINNFNRYISGIFKFFKMLYDEPGVTVSTAVLGQSPEDLLRDIKDESKGIVEVKFN